MNKNIGIALAIIVVLLGGYFLLNKKETQAPTVDELTNQASNTESNSTTGEVKPATSVSSKPAVQANATVEYTDSGYTPAFTPSITVIYKGQSVLFVNKSKSKMWVASGPHPAHTGYPGFDQKVGVAAGGSYLFTFNNTGKWSYHNHLDPQRVGTIVVKAP